MFLSLLHVIDKKDSLFLGTPPYQEEFGLLLLHVGMASLEAMGLRGGGTGLLGFPLLRLLYYGKGSMRMGRSLVGG